MNEAAYYYSSLSDSNTFICMRNISKAWRWTHSWLDLVNRSLISAHTNRRQTCSTDFHVGVQHMIQECVPYIRVRRFWFSIFAAAYLLCRLLIICRHIIAFSTSFCNLLAKEKNVGDKKLSTFHFLSLSLSFSIHTLIRCCRYIFFSLVVSLAAQQQPVSPSMHGFHWIISYFQSSSGRHIVIA